MDDKAFEKIIQDIRNFKKRVGLEDAKSPYDSLKWKRKKIRK